MDNENEFVDWLSEYGRLQYNESFDCLRSLYGVHDANYKIEVKFLMSLTTPAAYIVLGFWVRDYGGWPSEISEWNATKFTRGIITTYERNLFLSEQHLHSLLAFWKSLHIEVIGMSTACLSALQLRIKKKI